MTQGIAALPRFTAATIAAILAAVLVWRVLVVGSEALQSQSNRQNEQTAEPKPDSSDAVWRQRLARNPADTPALLALALNFEAQGKKDDAGAAMRQALRLAPGDLSTLMQAAGYFLRNGEEAQGLTTLRRAVDASRGQVNDSVWDVLVAAFDNDGNREFFDRLARDNPKWWPTFFRLACQSAANVGGLQALYMVRAQGAVARGDEQRCVIERLQRDGQWTDAYQFWLSALPSEQRKEVSPIFNGGFELPLSNVGFDWQIPAQEAVEVTTQATDGMVGQRALNIVFSNKRYTAPPIYQYLLLSPGRYSFDGSGRTDLETWLGLQWAIYCQDATAREPRQLTRSDRFIGAVDWKEFRAEFVVPNDCPVQVLRLELANPMRGANTPGTTVVRLKGRLWFDDLRVRILDR